MEARSKLVEVHARLFPADVEMLKQIAADSGVSFQVELRLLVRRALRGEKREIVMIKDQT